MLFAQTEGSFRLQNSNFLKKEAPYRQQGIVFTGILFHFGKNDAR